VGIRFITSLPDKKPMTSLVKSLSLTGIFEMLKRAITQAVGARLCAQRQPQRSMAGTARCAVRTPQRGVSTTRND
jgi:hypothetical protein